MDTRSLDLDIDPIKLSRKAIAAQFIIDNKNTWSALAKSAMQRMTTDDESLVFDVDGQFLVVTIHPLGVEIDQRTDWMVFPLSVQFYDTAMNYDGDQDDDGEYLEDMGPYGSIADVRMCYGAIKGRLVYMEVELDGRTSEVELF